MIPIKSGFQSFAQIGGSSFPFSPATNPNDIMLLARSSGSAGYRSSCRKPSATAGYQVPTGKKLIVLAVRMTNGSSNEALLTVAQVDNDVGIDVTTAFTNPVYWMGSSVSQSIRQPTAAGNNVGGYMEIGGLNFEVAADKYLGAQTNSTAGSDCITEFFCKLVNA